MKIKQVEGLLVASFPNSSVIFNCNNRRSYILNYTASLIWDFCKKPRDIAEIACFIHRKYDLVLSKALRDARSFVARLKKRQLLSVVR
ncbi:MAG: PqqD family protein [Candidatus Omnitrophica bacterium]|nr:PqqD family protein [Candidatus Omnitrophota bacterium]